ncbi:MAG: MutS-related protein [Chitinophagaceae bacterium]
MEIDLVTLEDLSIFNREEKFSIFHLLDFTRTSGGSDELSRIFHEPLSDHQKVIDTQKTLQFIASRIDSWPMEVTNGTVMVIEKFFDTHNEPIPGIQGGLSAINNLYYRIINSADYSIIRYSITHFIIFVQTLHKLITRLDGGEETPVLLKSVLLKASSFLGKTKIQELIETDSKAQLGFQKILYFGHAIKYQLVHPLEELINIYNRLDAWYSMAMAVRKFQFSFPEFLINETPRLDVEGLYHPLVKNPVAYNVHLSETSNFLFLTGANMAGKSTFIKAIGVAAYLAHLGMAVPAKNMQLTFFEGLLSNIQVQDNILLGESYFYNEVQRVKKTLLKINDGRRWLILIDELFKGTNFQDAQNCSTIVIKGLINMKESLFVLSTHLYEIAEGLKNYSNISFKYFETFVENETPKFSYQLKDGVSNDRLGFLILKREKVLDLLQQLK